MRKVIYSVKRLSKTNVTAVSGMGYISDEDLITASLSKAGKPYVRIYEDCIKNCHEIANRTNEYSGEYYEFVEIDGNDVQLNYSIWYKLVWKQMIE